MVQASPWQTTSNRHPRAVNVRETEHNRIHVTNTAQHQVIHRRSEFVYSVKVDRLEWMSFVNRQIRRTP